MNARMMVVGVVAIILAGSWAVAQTLPGNLKQGESLYQRHCVQCHGAAGDGLGRDVKDLIVPPADFHSLKSRSKTDAELLLAIRQGVLFSPMHGWSDRLSEQEMRDILSYIRMLVPFSSVG